jgi:hypothetical protein
MAAKILNEHAWQNGHQFVTYNDFMPVHRKVNLTDFWQRKIKDCDNG